MKQNRRSLRLHDSCVQKDVLTQKSANVKSKMGTKTPSNKAKVIVCDVCDSRFQTVKALRSHQNDKHPSEALKRDGSPDSRSKATPKNTPAATQTSRSSKRLQLRKGRDRDTEESENSEDQGMEEQNKIEFSCPKCSKMFSIYFQAMKHIQKKHCEDSDGNVVSPNSPDLIKPVSVETCCKCHKHIDSSHICTSSPAIVNRYINILLCLGCDKQFQNVGLFNLHATNIHRNNLDSMFFKTFEEFNMWKQVMETQVKVKYLALNKSSSQKYYQCNYVSPKNESNTTYLCPSIIEFREVGPGIQIYYCKQHHGHEVPDYQIPEEFLQYLTNKKEDKSEFDVLIKDDPDDTLYVRFKDLMKNISTDAKKVSIPHLRKLFNSALEMQGLLNSCDEDHDDKDVLINKSMTDAQITDALEGKRTSARLKRKSETRISIDTKRKKDEKSDDGNMNNNSESNKDENANKTVSKENKEYESPKVKATPSSALLSPSSFNDTYKQFLGPQLESTKKVKNTKPKEIVKTRMGQFSPKKKLPVKETVEKSKPNILKPSKLNTSFGKDIKYEVREQENDCNILILKI